VNTADHHRDGRRGRCGRRVRCRGDAGLAGVEVLPFGLLVFVIGGLLVANAWAVVDTKLAVSAASREAVRVYVEASGPAEAATAADATARAVIAGHGRRPERLVLEVRHLGDEPWRRCAQVLITARYQVPALSLPWIGGYGSGFEVVSAHSERIDPFRAGLPVGGRC
jgi:hypothetical protein